MKETLLSWLRYVIDESGLHTRSEWGHIIGVSPQAQGRWLSGKDTPRPDTLRRLLAALRDDPAESGREALARWDAIAKRSLAEVSPGSKQDTATLAHLMVEPLWHHLERTLRALPPEVQEKLLTSALRAANQHVLERDRGGVVTKRPHDAPAATLEAIAPAAVMRYGAQPIKELRREIWKDRTFWPFAARPN